MAKESLVNGLQPLFHHLEKDGTTIDRAALLPAYEGMVEGLFILVVSLPGAEFHFEKVKYIVNALHRYVPIDQRRGITGVQVFNSAEEFDEFIQFGYLVDSDEERIRRGRYKPELIPIAA